MKTITGIHELPFSCITESNHMGMYFIVDIYPLTDLKSKVIDGGVSYIELLKDRKLNLNPFSVTEKEEE